MVDGAVREILFLVTPVICVRIRGRESEVTTTCLFRSDFRLQLRSYSSGFIVLFPCYFPRKHKTYRYTV